MPRLTQYIEIDKEAKRRRRAHNYECRFDWPEMAAVDAKLAPLMAEHLKRASALISISSRLSDAQDEEKVYTDVMLVRDFLLRATMALRSTLCLVSIGHDGDAWATARVIAERAIYLAYILKTGKAKEFMESRWFELKKWAYKVPSPSLGLLRELAIDYDAVSEEVWGRKLRRPAQHENRASTWSDPGIEQMCREAFGQEASGIYSLYRDMSARLHPGMHDGGDEYLAEALTATLGVVRQRYPWPLKAALDAFGALMDRVEPVLRGA